MLQSLQKNDAPPLPLKGKLALITGASRGIGAAVARRYAQEGAHVVLVARSSKNLEQVDDAIREDTGRDDAATLVPLDLREGGLIDALGAQLYERFGKLDILVGNAAVLGELTPMAHLRPKLWDELIATNLTANYRLIRSMDPLLRQSESADVILVTSGVTRGTSPFWGGYAITKTALECMANTYRAEVEKTHINVHLVDPGVVQTHMRALAFPGEDAQQHPRATERSVTDRFVAPLLNRT